MPGASSSELRRFGLTVGGIFVLLGALSRWRGHTWPPIVFVTVGVLLFVPGLVAPLVLGPVQRVWMRFAAILGEVNSRIILTVFFYLVLAPVGWVLRVFVRDPLDRALDAKRESDWIKREPRPLERARYEQQF
jgi:Saxitoxin biosynthesis operon protein SxtJ